MTSSQIVYCKYLCQFLFYMMQNRDNFCHFAVEENTMYAGYV